MSHGVSVSYDVLWCLLMSLLSYGALWCLVMSHGCVMVSYVVSWCYMVPYDVLWCLLVSYSFSYCFMVSQNVWRFMVSYETSTMRHHKTS